MNFNFPPEREIPGGRGGGQSELLTRESGHQGHSLWRLLSRNQGTT